MAEIHIVPYKQCSGLTHIEPVLLPATEFYAVRSSPDGLSAVCKACTRYAVRINYYKKKGKKVPSRITKPLKEQAWKSQNKEKLREYHREYDKKRRDKLS